MPDALPIGNPITPPPGPRGVRWIDAATAAQRSGWDERTIRRRCGEEWLAQGLARVERGGGRSKWMVREDADAAFARVLMPEQMAVDLQRLSAEQRRQLLQRKRLLDGLEQARKNGLAMGHTLAVIDEQFASRISDETGLKLSVRTLHRWQADFRAGGTAGLVDQRWLRWKVQGGGEGSGDDPFVDAVKSYYLSPLGLSKRACWLMACQKAEENGWTAKELKTTTRILKAIPPAVVIKFRRGEDAYVAECEPSIRRDYSTLASNEQWVGDHHQFDVMVSHRGKIVRPWLTAWMDMRSRMIVGWCIVAHDPNQNCILSALRGGCLDHGVPLSLYIDNGKDFDSYAFHGRSKSQRRRFKIVMDQPHTRGILNQLGCTAHFCWAYHGQSKPIERWFGTVEDQFGRTWPTYCGNKPENRPDNLELRIDRGAAPTLEQFTAAFADYLKVYNTAPHTGDGMEGRSPEQVYAASWNGTSRRTHSPQFMDLLLMKQSQPVKVTKNGVRWNHLQYGQHEPELTRRLGQEVYLRVDERDMRQVQVWSLEDSFICIAPCNQWLPANTSEQHLREAISEKKHHRKAVNDYHRSRPHLHDDIGDRLRRAAAADNAKRLPDPPTPTPPNAQPIRSALEDQMPAVERAMQAVHRKAAGAENLERRFSLFDPSVVAKLDEEAEIERLSHLRLGLLFRDRAAAQPADEPELGMSFRQLMEKRQTEGRNDE